MTKLNCMLASQNNGKFKGLNFKVEVKLDGVRCLAINEGGRITLYSRNSKRFLNFTAVEKTLTEHMPSNSVWDGEVVSGDFNNLMTQVHRKHNANCDDATFVVFECMPLEDFIDGKVEQPDGSRTGNIKLGNVIDIDTYGADFNQIVQFNNADDNATKNACFIRLADEAAKAGHEGIIVKEIGSPYVGKRSRGWIKVKPSISLTLNVVDVLEGTGKYEGMLGALVCKGTDEGKYIEVNVGTGLNDQQREEIWNAREAVTGHLIEIGADSITKNAHGTHSLRFPRFISFRGFDINEKL